MRDTSDRIKTYIWEKGKNRPLPRHPRAVALGVFDGMHLGHRAVIMQAAGMPISGGGYAVSTVFSFAQPPCKLPKKEAWELISPDQKRELFVGLGVEEWIQTDFEAIRGLTPAQFVRDFLHETLDARRVCCGFNYKFGKDGAGNADTLRELCAPLGIEVVVASPVVSNGQAVSASRIRRLIEIGEIGEAVRLLGHPFTLDMEVVGGKQLGRLLGTPTINQPLPPNFVRPKFGVYASSVIVDGRVTHGVTNIGIRPTVGADTPLAETWIAGFDGDLYGQSVPVSLIRFLRPEKKFDSIEALQKQILMDAKQAQTTVMGETDGQIRAVLFDFDDTLQNRPVAFLQYCDFFLEKYFPGLSGDESENRRQQMLVRNNGGYVDYIDYFTSIIADWGWKDAPPVDFIYRELQYRFPEYTALFPEAADVLNKLKNRGYLVGVITNGPTLTQNRKLDVSGLRPLLDITVVSGDEQAHKPDPEIFRRAASRLGISCESCVYVGDHPVNDIQGARSAGMKPVYINALNIDVHPENVPEIKNLNEFFALLEDGTLK